MEEHSNLLYQLLADIKDALDHLVKTVTEDQQSGTALKKEEAETELKAVVRLPEEVTKYYESEERERSTQKSYETIRTILEVAGVAAAIGLAILTLCTLRTLNRQLAEMHRQTCLQQQASINAERAWVGLDGPPQVEVGSLKQKTYTAQINLNIKNFGKGPALNVFTGSQIALHGHVAETLTATCNLIFPFVGLQPTGPVTSSEDITKLHWGQLIFPNQPLLTGTNIVDESTDVLGQEVFIVGCIVYKDQFEQPHWTKFSYSTGPYVTQVVRDAASFRHLYISSANNYTDDAEKKPACPN
jgi:hypothetical protein